jgi:putative protease
VDDIYLDFSCYTRENLTAALKKDVSEIKESKKKAYFIFPTVFRLSTARFYESIREELINSGIDGVVVKSADALQFVREQLKLSFIIDANLYTFNNQAKQLLQTYEPLRDTVPFELNRRELLARDNRNSEIVIYGHLPLMTSAQCVHANSGKCDKKPQTMYLKDRYGKFFPVKNQCSECYNTIYNTAPLVLFPFRRDFEKMKLFHYRIAFTTENENRAKEVLAAYRKLFIEEKGTVADYFAKEYTNGHYKRGVE